MGLQTVSNLSVHRKPAGQIISNITWIINDLPFFQTYRTSGSKGIVCTGKHHHFPFLNFFFQFSRFCLCICIPSGYGHFHIRKFLHRRLRIFFGFRILFLFLPTIFFCMGLSFRIRQDNLTSNRVAITLIFWHNPVSCNISPCLVWMIRTAILCFDTFQSHILFFRIILNPFHAGLCHKFLVGNIFGDILCSHCLLRNFRHRMLRFFLTFFFCHSIL